MKTHSSTHLIIALLTCTLAAPLLAADGWTLYKARPGSSVKIDGTSTIHDWTVETKLIGGTMELGPSFPLGSDKKPEPGSKVEAKAETFVMVNSIKSGTKRMDEVMYETMNQDGHPKITYKLQDLSVKKEQPAEGPTVFDAVGLLTVYGTTVTNNMEVTFEPQPGDKLVLHGKTTMKMTDFGMKPPAPTVGLGLIRTGDDVVVTLNWVTAKSD